MLIRRHHLSLTIPQRSILHPFTKSAAAAFSALRGVYYALFEEGGVPQAVMGTATGIVSVIGYTPDIFMPILGGALLDSYPGALGYRYVFAFIAGLCVFGLLAALTIKRKYGRRSPN